MLPKLAPSRSSWSMRKIPSQLDRTSSNWSWVESRPQAANRRPRTSPRSPRPKTRRLRHSRQASRSSPSRSSPSRKPSPTSPSRSRSLSLARKSPSPSLPRNHSQNLRKRSLPSLRLAAGPRTAYVLPIWIRTTRANSLPRSR
jgi:hypothetical protein